MTNATEIKFNAFMPAVIEKSVDVLEGATNQKSFYVNGYASTAGLDRQGDIVNPKGISIDILMEDGYINFEHERDKVIGVPTEKCYVDPDKGLYIEAKLFEDNPYAQEMINLAEQLQKSGTGRTLGFSIEGMVKKRNINDSRVIEELMITNIALVKQPANTECRADLVLKSFLTGNGITPEAQVDAGALRRESLASSITNLTYALKIKNPKDHKELWNGVVEYLTKSDNMGYEESILTLQLARGLSRKDAELAVLNITKGRLENGERNE